MEKTKLPFFLFLLLPAMALSSCEAIGAIFKAGVWVGIIIVVIILVIIFWLIKKFSN
jgi:hypothetical protein